MSNSEPITNMLDGEAILDTESVANEHLVTAELPSGEIRTDVRGGTSLEDAQHAESTQQDEHTATDNIGAATDAQPENEEQFG